MKQSVRIWEVISIQATFAASIFSSGRLYSLILLSRNPNPPVQTKLELVLEEVRWAFGGVEDGERERVSIVLIELISSSHFVQMLAAIVGNINAPKGVGVAKGCNSVLSSRILRLI